MTVARTVPVGATGPDSRPYVLVLRLAGPMQSWGGPSEFNRRATLGEPTKSGIIGMLAAALGRRRADPIEDLLTLRLGVRTDQPGSLLRDYHTASDQAGQPLLSAQVNAKGRQRPTSPPKFTHVTQRYYLQDAVFVAAVGGPADLLTGLAAALRRPEFPLFLGRRSCPPTQPLLVRPDHGDGDLWEGQPDEVLQRVPWMAREMARERLRREAERRGRPVPATIDLPLTVDIDAGQAGGPVDVRTDVPRSFDQRERGFVSRWVRHDWARGVVTGLDQGAGNAAVTSHDPFALLGW